MISVLLPCYQRTSFIESLHKAYKKICKLRIQNVSDSISDEKKIAQNSNGSSSIQV